MSYITKALWETATPFYEGMHDKAVKIKKGILILLKEGSHIAFDICTLDGYEKLAKALIADLKFISLLPAMKGVFDECLKTLEAQKDLYYATMIINSTAEMWENKNQERSDPVKVLNAIGNFFETGKFLQKNEIYPFETCVEVANTMASTKVYGNITLNDIPVLGSICDKPKDLCVFLGSSIEIYRCIKKPRLEWEFALKLTGSIGKVALTSLGKYYNKEWWFFAIDLITQNDSFLKRVVDQYTLRKRRFSSPAA